ncbi:MAG: peroxiredoxin family protein [Methylocystaceae bacterium]
MQELPELEKFYSQHHGEAELLTVSTDPAADILTIQEQNKLTFPTLFDKNGRVFAQYGVRTIPMTFIINAQGQIIKQLPGPVKSEELLKYIK